ncbi:hypothetical protein JS533_012140 [Bifidobacterium amazonense]|uniref:Uncharacterized protein n=1 Tax=Bifidobacterium amazonense TaxID=2809027 RepID=A0ABS9VY09_9BIFI|nr:hypothetical protein [Bifidobacterium amazonense]MCH9277005.1 hypothetical protein [Bifidobacterium amazonense]
MERPFSNLKNSAAATSYKQISEKPIVALAPRQSGELEEHTLSARQLLKPVLCVKHRGMFVDQVIDKCASTDLMTDIQRTNNSIMKQFSPQSLTVITPVNSKRDQRITGIRLDAFLFNQSSPTKDRSTARMFKE